jgi:hypothetical protein
MSKTLPSRGKGRPEHTPTGRLRSLVLALRVCGCSGQQIAQVAGLAHSTLRLHYRNELEHGTRELMGRLAWTAVQRAAAGDSSMLAFVLSRRGAESWGGAFSPEQPEQPGASPTRARLHR